MGTKVILALRAVLVACLAGSVFVQAVMVPLLAIDMRSLRPELAGLRVPVLTFIVLGVLTTQVAMVCVWRLVTMARRGTVFSSAAFRYVDIIIGAAAAASVIVFAFAFTLARSNHWVPDDAVAPGVVLLICGVSLAAAGVALLVLVMRALLAQAVARDAEASGLRAELDEVI